MSTILYYNDYSSPSRKVLIALYEKNVEFESKKINLMKREQHEEWYLKEVNPRGEVPVLKDEGKLIAESGVILKYIDEKFGRSNQLFPQHQKPQIETFIKKIDEISFFILTYGMVCFQAEGITKVLRYPYNQTRETIKVSLPQRALILQQVADKYQGSEIGKIFEDKLNALEKSISIMSDRRSFKNFLSRVEGFLDYVEKELSKEERLGPWLFGAEFTAADISFTGLLVRLYQLGLDDQYWKDGQRPHVAMYEAMAFRRSSVQKATLMNSFNDEYSVVKPYTGDEDGITAIQAAQMGLGAAAILGGVYAIKKLIKR